MAVFMQLVKDSVKMSVMNRTVISLASAVLQQMCELVAAGVRQQIKSAQLTSEVSPRTDFPAR
jgi:hypothetical protein